MIGEPSPLASVIVRCPVTENSGGPMLPLSLEMQVVVWAGRLEASQFESKMPVNQTPEIHHELGLFAKLIYGGARSSKHWMLSW